MSPYSATSTHRGKTLLLIGGGIETVPGIERLRSLGLSIAVSDGSPQAPGLALADHALIASTYDASATIIAARSLARQHPIDGVMSIAVDVPLTVAGVAEALSLPHIPIQAARITTDKFEMKRVLRRAGVAVPDFWSVASLAELRSLVASVGTPLVIKPVDSRGARGVLRLTPEIDLDWAYQTALSHSPSGKILVERYIAGPQISSETLVSVGRTLTLGFSDRNYEALEIFAPHMIENGGEQPSRLLDCHYAAVDSLIGECARALSLTDGVIKGDIVIDREQGPMVIEVAPRLSGGFFCTDQIPLSTGVDIVCAAARIALGETLDLDDMSPAGWRPVAIRYFCPPAGTLRKVHGLADLRREPWVARTEVFVDEGDAIGSPTDHTGRAGYVIALGQSREQAVERAERATRALRFDVLR